MIFVVFSILFLVVAPALAQSQTIVNPTTAAPSATVLPSASGYVYAGCWNETTGVPGTNGARALADGNFSANNTLTITSCLSFCARTSSSSGGSQYAGIEYGRECYCAPYLSPFSTRLNDSSCLFACDGNSSEICGGSLAITLYNRTEGSHTGVGWAVVQRESAAWYAVLGLGMLGFALFL